MNEGHASVLGKLANPWLWLHLGEAAHWVHDAIFQTMLAPSSFWTPGGRRISAYAMVLLCTAPSECIGRGTDDIFCSNCPLREEKRIFQIFAPIAATEEKGFHPLLEMILGFQNGRSSGSIGNLRRIWITAEMTDSARSFACKPEEGTMEYSKPRAAIS